MLHFFQALIYVAVAVLTWQERPAGFGGGLCVGLFWDILFVNVAGRDLVQELGSFFRTGQGPHASLLLSLFAALGHLLIIIACVIGFIRLRPAARQWMETITGGILALVYLVGVVFLFGPPQAIEIMKQVFGL